jgi:UDP-N-acetylmuramoyl-tripeptide--D-alanyl-D-alanine ligase
MDISSLYQVYKDSTGVITDTRQITQGCVFFALKGDKFNANLFAIEALEKGAAYAVIDEAQISGQYQHRLIVVQDVLSTMQALAAYHRRNLDCPVLAITGSNGKTTTKELMAAVMSRKYRTVATQGNLNNHIGVPLTILDTEFLILEMGANHQREIAGYCEYANPGYGLITNIGKAHLEGFGGEEGVLKGKTELYAAIAKKNGKVFVSALSDILIKKAVEYISRDHIIYYGDGEAISTGEFLTVQATGELKIQTQLIGTYNFENIMAAICTGRYFQVGDDDIKEAIESYIPSNNRSQKLSIGTNTILLDAYNANPSSMAEALRNFDKINAPNKIAILGEMMELGPYSGDEHQKIVDTVKQMGLAQCIYVGEGFKMLKGISGVSYFDTTDALKRWYKAQHFENSTQLIKGSRKNALEKILD